MKLLTAVVLMICAAGCSAKWYPRPVIWPPMTAPTYDYTPRWTCWEDDGGDVHCLDVHGQTVRA